MLLFEVMIPGKGKNGQDIVGTVSADSWLPALSQVLKKTGVKVADVSSLLCDVDADGMLCITGAHDETFFVKPLAEDSDDAVVHLQEKPPCNRVNKRVNGGKSKEALDDLIADLMMETESLHECETVEEAAQRILDLAIKAIPSEAGSVLLSDINGLELTFAAASGPKAEVVKSLTLKVGQGIVGFCAQNGVSLGIADAKKDPRFHREISDKVGFDTRSLLCSPAQQGGRVYGAIELINRKNGDSFDQREVDVLNFLSHEFVEYLVRRNP